MSTTAKFDFFGSTIGSLYTTSALFVYLFVGQRRLCMYTYVIMGSFELCMIWRLGMFQIRDRENYVYIS